MNRSKLLATIAVFAMVASAFAVIAVSDDSDAATWNMDGDINADQPIQAGTNAVATGDFNITNKATLTIKSGASFVINEGVTVTVKEGSSIEIQNGASVVVDGELIVEKGASIENNATYDGTNKISGNYTGLIVNGDLVAEKGSTISNYTSTPNDYTDNSKWDSAEITKYAGVGGAGYDINGNIVTDAVPQLVGYKAKGVSDARTIVSMSGTVHYLKNGEGNFGYWVGLRVTETAADGTPVKVTYDGRNSTEDLKITSNSFIIWLTAGKVTQISYTVGDNEKEEITVDTTGMSYEYSTQSGDIVVGETGSVAVESSGKTPGKILNQRILVSTGAVIDINGAAANVEVRAMSSTAKYPYTFGAVAINSTVTSVEGLNSITEFVDLTFGVTSEKVSSAFIDGNTKTTRAINYILNVDGDVNASNTISILKTAPVNGQKSALYYPNEDGDASSGVPMAGIVGIDGTLSINGQGAKLNAAAGSILNISGTLEADGDKGKVSVIVLSGIVNVSGSMDIANVDDTGDKDRVDLAIAGTTYLNIIGSGSVVIENYDMTSVVFGGINGASYENDGTTNIASLQTIIDAAAAAKEDLVHVYGYDEEANTVLYNPYVIDSDMSIPDGMNLCIDGILEIGEGVTLTISEDAEIDSDKGGLIVVEGTVLDYSMYTFGDESVDDYTSVSEGEVKISAQVRSTDADETYYTYTTLKNALATTTSGTIELFGEVPVDGTMTIQDGVTVDLAGKTITVEAGSTLVVNGVIDSSDAGSGIVIEAKTDTKAEGVLTLNNMIVEPAITDGTNAKTIAGFTANGTIGDFKDCDFLLAPEVAAENAAALTDIEAVGKLTYSSDLTFTAGESNEGDAIVITGEDVSISKIVLNGFGFSITGKFTGTVETSVTAGSSAVAFTKATGYSTATAEKDSGESIIITMTLSASNALGKVVIATGTVELVTDASFGTTKDDVLVVNDGATLIVSKAITIAKCTAVSEKDREFVAITIDGTMDVAKGSFTFIGGCVKETIAVNGMMNIEGAVTLQDVTVGGTIATSTVAGKEGTVKLTGTTSVEGTLSGVFNLGTTSDFVKAFPGSTVDANKMNVENGVSGVDSVGVYINGELYMTVYGLKAATVSSAIGTDDFEIVGYEDVDTDTKWYTDADLKTELDANADLEDTQSVYTKLQALPAKIQVSVGSQISLFVDGVKIETNLLAIPQAYVGEHTVTVTINPGYTGDVTIMFNGQEITDGKFTITPEMADENADVVVLSVTGNISVDTGSFGSSDNGMGITDYLLIILVVMVVILAIVVIMRMMRS